MDLVERTARALDRSQSSFTTIGYDPRFNAETFYWSSSQDTLVLKHPAVGAPGRYRYSDATVEAFAGLEFARDSLRLTSERWNGGHTQWDEFSRDRVGRLTSIDTWEDNDSGNVECTWDEEVGRICTDSGSTTWLGTESFVWDEVGNPDAAGDSVEVDNRLVELGSSSPITLSYDADGNITSRSGGNPSETVTYWWNALSQLDSAESSVSGKIRYRYDGFGRRVYEDRRVVELPLHQGRGRQRAGPAEQLGHPRQHVHLLTVRRDHGQRRRRSRVSLQACPDHPILLPR